MSKLVSASEAVRAHVHDGDTVYLGGFTHLIPFALGHEMIRQGLRGLTLCRATPDLIYDQMIAAGCAAKVVFSWAGNPGVGLLHAFRRAVESGGVEVEEYTHFGLVARLRAAAMGLPFLPLRTNFATDLARANPEIRTVTCPYTGARMSTVPALVPDVAVLHVQRADAEGNAQLWGIRGEQQEAAFAARRVIVSAEEIVAERELRRDPDRVVVPGFLVSAVVHEPLGAHPSYAQGFYDRDNGFYLEWDAISRDPGRLSAWLDEWVLGLADRRAYAERLGAERVEALRRGAWVDEGEAAAAGGPAGGRPAGAKEGSR